MPFCQTQMGDQLVGHHFPHVTFSRWRKSHAAIKFVWRKLSHCVCLPHAVVELHRRWVGGKGFSSLCNWGTGEMSLAGMRGVYYQFLVADLQMFQKFACSGPTRSPLTKSELYPFHQNIKLMAKEDSPNSLPFGSTVP